MFKAILNKIRKKLTPAPDVLYVHGPTKLGGPGTCRHCGKQVSNQAFHEARCHQEQIDDSMAAMEAALKVLQERTNRRKTERPPSSIRGIKEWKK